MVLLLLLLQLCTAPHPLHISVCEVQYNSGARTLEVTQKVFIDDLEAALLPVAQRHLHLGTPQEDAEANKFLQAYLLQRLSFATDGTPAPLSYLGHEADKEAVWLYMEVKAVAPFHTVVVSNSVLFELYDDQANLVNLTRTGQLRSARLRPGEARATLRWE